MPFFLPRRLVGLEYFGDEEDAEYEEIAEPYQNDIDFAFFAVNFGYSYSDYCELTKRQRAFIYKAYENKYASDIMKMYKANFTSFYNVSRPKRKKALMPLEKSLKPADKDTAMADISAVVKMEHEKGKGWVEKIYAANGMRKEGSNG